MIESITATIPVTGMQYTDLRPTITAGSIEEYREQLAEVGKMAGNIAFASRMLTDTKPGRVVKKAGDTTLYFDAASHTYEDKDGRPYLTGSTFAGLYEVPFKGDLVAKKVAEKRLTTVDQVLAGWALKGEVSCDYGTTVHKALECGIKYNELPNNPHLLALVQDYLDATHTDEQASEVFVADPEERLCGTIDVVVNKGRKHVVIRDFKTSDIYKQVSLTPEAKELWPNLESKLVSIYHLQLSFYAHILTKQGYKVDLLEVWAEDAEAWRVYEAHPLDITKALKQMERK